MAPYHSNWKAYIKHFPNIMPIRDLAAEMWWKPGGLMTRPKAAASESGPADRSVGQPITERAPSTIYSKGIQVNIG